MSIKKTRRAMSSALKANHKTINELQAKNTQLTGELAAKTALVGALDSKFKEVFGWWRASQEELMETRGEIRELEEARLKNEAANNFLTKQLNEKLRESGCPLLYEEESEREPLKEFGKEKMVEGIRLVLDCKELDLSEGERDTIRLIAKRI